MLECNIDNHMWRSFLKKVAYFFSNRMEFIVLLVYAYGMIAF